MNEVPIFETATMRNARIVRELQPFFEDHLTAAIIRNAIYDIALRGGDVTTEGVIDELLENPQRYWPTQTEFFPCL